MASSLVIELVHDFVADEGVGISVIDNGTITFYQWTFVATRSNPFEITVGTPTGIVGETSAINLKAAIDIDLAGDYTTAITANELTVTAVSPNINFIGFKASDASGIGQRSYYNVTFNNTVPPVDNSNVECIVTRSPHYINTPFDFSTTTSVVISLYVWDGDLSSVPVSPTYTLTKIRPSIDFAEANTDISMLVNDELDAVPNIVLTTTSQITDAAATEVKWVKWVASYIDAVEAIADREDTLVGIRGFGYYTEGVNPTVPSTNILTSTTNRKVDRNGFVLLPFYNNSEITSIDISTETNEINETETVTASDVSTKMVQYLSVDVSQASSDVNLTVTFNPSGDVINYEIVDECRYEPKQIVFRNRFGLYDTITLFKKQTTAINTTNDDFTNAYISAGTYNTTDHQKQKINIQGSETITCNSGYINEKENAIYQEMMLSERVFFYESGVLIPVNVASKQLEFKTRVNDSLVNYTINFEYAYNLIQNV